VQVIEHEPTELIQIELRGRSLTRDKLEECLLWAQKNEENNEKTVQKSLDVLLSSNYPQIKSKRGTTVREALLLLYDQNSCTIQANETVEIHYFDMCGMMLLVKFENMIGWITSSAICLEVRSLLLNLHLATNDRVS
jgi:hypothetical protein